MGDIPKHFQGDWTLNIPSIGGEKGGYYPFKLTATEFTAPAVGAKTTKPTYTGPPAPATPASSTSSSGSTTPKATPSVDYRGATIQWHLVVGADTTTYTMKVNDAAGTTMSGPYPPEALARAQLKGQSQVTAKELTQAQLDAKMKAFHAATITATKGGGMGTMETMLVVVLGLGIVWMLMNYKK